MKTVLTIGGSDPSGWAGIQSDILTFSYFRIRPLSVISALTVQTEKKVETVKPVSAGFLKIQAETLLKKHKIDAMKIGMLSTKENVEEVKDLIKKWKLKNVVLDPVFTSTSGHTLLEKKGIQAIKKLIPFVTIVTPNIGEAEALSDIRIKNIEDMKQSARIIKGLGASYVLIKGGHLRENPIDILFDGKRFRLFKGKRLKGKKEIFHGTGCMLSSAIAAGLAKGTTVKRAVDFGKKYVAETIGYRATDFSFKR